MPKIPSGPKRKRIKFCIACDRELAWEVQECPHCGRNQSGEDLAPDEPPTRAGAWVYDVVPFMGRIQGDTKENARTVSAQLKIVINSYAEKGWEFYSVDKVSIEVNPGCLGSLMGKRAEYVDFDQVIFRRPR